MVPRPRLPSAKKLVPFGESRLLRISTAFCNLGDLISGQALEVEGEVVDAQLASLSAAGACLWQSRECACGGRRRIALDLDQAAACESGDDPAHGRRFDLLGGGQFTQCFRASEDQDGKRGEARRAFSGGNILLAQAAQKMDGGRVQPVGDGDEIRIGSGAACGKTPSAQTDTEVHRDSFVLSGS